MHVNARQPFGTVATFAACEYPPAERGATLFVALMFMLILTIFGVTAVTTSTLQEKMAANLKDQQMAFQNAETALREAEAWLSTLTEPPPVITGPLGGSDAVWPQMAQDLTGPGIDLGWWSTNGYAAIPDPNSRGAYFIIEERGQTPITNVHGVGPDRTTIFYYRVSAYGAGVTALSSSVTQTTFVMLF
jgi:type IV pilus assembly protein PilX